MHLVFDFVSISCSFVIEQLDWQLLGTWWVWTLAVVMLHITVSAVRAAVLLVLATLRLRATNKNMRSDQHIGHLPDQ